MISILNSSATRRAAMLAIAVITLFSAALPARAADPVEVPVFITIGQSNADGSAFFDPSEDSRLRAWYTSDANPHTMKIWYRSTRVHNQPQNALGEPARWAVDGKVTDVQPGWLDLWYRNENTEGRTAMNMIHNFGTYSTGSGTDCAQGRRGIEGEFGKRFAEAFPGSELYVIKLGVSGSHISAWANPADDTNWRYFYENMFRPAINDLLARGKRPVLAGIWWMQGCADSARESAYYSQWLRALVERCRKELGFADGRFYIGHIIGPGECAEYPNGSVQYGPGVRQAQDIIAALLPGVETIDTRDCRLQYEPNFNGYLHFSHKGINTLADKIADRIIAEGPAAWAPFSTPGTWTSDGLFIPSVGNPAITYSRTPDTITATLTYPTWSETKTLPISSTKGSEY